MLSLLLLLLAATVAVAEPIAEAPPLRSPVYADNPPEGISPEEAKAALKLPDDVKLHDSKNDEGWEFFKSKEDIEIYARIRPGSKIKEGIGIGTFDAPPCRVAQMLMDHANLPSFMPYIQVSLLTNQRYNEEHYCQYLDLPWPLADRKYNLVGRKYNLTGEGPCHVVIAWEKDETNHPCTQEDFEAHVEKYKKNSMLTAENLGYWNLVGYENNTKTKAEYYIFTDPGGSVPPSVQNWFVDDAVHSVYDAGRKRLAEEGIYPDCKCSPTEIP